MVAQPRLAKSLLMRQPAGPFEIRGVQPLLSPKRERERERERERFIRKPRPAASSLDRLGAKAAEGKDSQVLVELARAAASVPVSKAGSRHAVLTPIVRIKQHIHFVERNKPLSTWKEGGIHLRQGACLVWFVLVWNSCGKPPPPPPIGVFFVHYVSLQ